MIIINLKVIHIMILRKIKIYRYINLVVGAGVVNYEQVLNIF